jgi:hypothetical protein
MEDFLFPMHMIRMESVGDVAIAHRDSGGSLIFQNTTTIPPSKSKDNNLVHFEGGGTGFIISITEIKIKSKQRRIALVLTAGHVVCNPITFQPIMDILSCRLESGKSRDVYLVKAFMELFPSEMKSDVMDSEYCLPGDAAICIMRLKRKDTVAAFEIASKIKIGARCHVAGYPQRPPNIEYSLPQLCHLDETALEHKANEVFCNFCSKVYAKGRILGLNKNLIEVACSTTNGMSGSL